MHPHILLASVFLAVMGGCVSTHTVDANKTDEWIRPAQDILLGEDVTVRTVDNRAYNGKLIQLSPDSVKLQDYEGGALVTEDLSRVVFIGEPTNATAPILGCLGGVVVGLVIGGAIGAEEPEASSGGVNTISSAAMGGIIGGVVGGAAGVTIGGLATRVDQYEIHQSGKRPAVKPDSGPEKNESNFMTHSHGWYDSPIPGKQDSGLGCPILTNPCKQPTSPSSFLWHPVCSLYQLHFRR